MLQISAIYVERITDSGYDMGHTGIDVRKDATVLAIAGLNRLSWEKATMYNAWPGCHSGGAMRYAPVHLTLRTFRIAKDGRISYDTSVVLAEGGRLSKSRLTALKDDIDGKMGAGVTEAIDLKKTLIVGEDPVGDWIAKQNATPRYVSSSVLALLEKMQNTTESYGGLKL